MLKALPKEQCPDIVLLSNWVIQTVDVHNCSKQVLQASAIHVTIALMGFVVLGLVSHVCLTQGRRVAKLDVTLGTLRTKQRIVCKSSLNSRHSEVDVQKWNKRTLAIDKGAAFARTVRTASSAFEWILRSGPHRRSFLRSATTGTPSVKLHGMPGLNGPERNPCLNKVDFGCVPQLHTCDAPRHAR